MGMVTSCCGRRPKKSRLHSEHDLMPPYKKKHRRDISATYSANDFVMTLDQLNINQATEEELMTLSSITRNVARNIIQYRNHIGGFRKAEDLALVSGVGANKLAIFRMEIYCGKYDPGTKPSPNMSSRRSSNRLSALGRQNPEAKIDVNRATTAELSKVSGIGGRLAQRIVDYRSEVGQYRFLTDVSKVPEIGTYYFEKIRHLLTVDDNDSTSSASTSVSIVEDFSSDSLPLMRERLNGTLPSGNGYARDSLVTSSTQTDSQAMPTPFATMPRRKSRTTLRRTPSHKIGKVRLASWNLQRLSLEKSRNPGVKEVICMTVLENGLSLVACQDIVDSTALDEICTELNSPSLGPVRAWSGHRGNWTSITAHSADPTQQNAATCGFLWDTSQGVRLKHSYRLKLTPNGTVFAPSAAMAPFLGRFAVLHSDLSVLNIPFCKEVRGQMVDEEAVVSVEAIVRTIEQYFPDKESMLLASDAPSGQEVNDLSTLTSNGFIHLSPLGHVPNGVHHAPGLKHTNHLLLSNDLQKRFRGSCGVIKEGLTHPLIPVGWRWGGAVSDHSLAWVELSFQL